MDIEVVTAEARLSQIGPNWHTLWQQSRGSVFQAHCWIAAWLSESRDHRLRIACAWRDHKLVAVLPLCIHRWRGIRILEWAAQPYSDYCAPLQEPADAVLLGVMWSAVERMGGYDLVRLKHVHPDAAIKRLLASVGTEERTEVCLQVACEWPNGEAWFRTLNKKTRNNLMRSGRILAEHGDIVFRQLGVAEPRQPVIDRLLKLKRQWLENRMSPLVRSDTILLALVEALDQLGSLKIFLIERAGTIIAGSVNAIQSDRMLALFATYDPAYDRASPGILLMSDYTKWAFDHGITEIDYLLGSEPYKFKFANRKVRLHIFVAGKTAFGRLALAAYQWMHCRPSDPDIAIGSAYRTQKGSVRNTPATEIVAGATTVIPHTPPNDRNASENSLTNL